MACAKFPPAFDHMCILVENISQLSFSKISAAFAFFSRALQHFLSFFCAIYPPFSFTFSSNRFSLFVPMFLKWKRPLKHNITQMHDNSVHNSTVNNPHLETWGQQDLPCLTGRGNKTGRGREIKSLQKFKKSFNKSIFQKCPLQTLGLIG